MNAIPKLKRLAAAADEEHHTQRIDSNLFPSTRLLCIQIVMSSLPLARRKKDCSNLEFLNFQVESVTLGHLVSFEK